MEKKVSLSSKLSPFRMNLEGLESFLKKLMPEFGVNPKLDIHIDTKDISYTFSSVEEIRNCPDILPRIKKFRICLRNSPFSQSLYLHVGELFASGEITANSSSEAWCSGIIGATVRFIKPYQRWYGCLKKMPSKIIFTASGCLPLLLDFIGLKIPRYFFWPVMVIWTVLILEDYFFPSTFLDIKENQSFFRRYNSELKIILTVLSIAVPCIVSFLLRNHPKA